MFDKIEVALRRMSAAHKANMMHDYDLAFLLSPFDIVFWVFRVVLLVRQCSCMSAWSGSTRRFVCRGGS